MELILFVWPLLYLFRFQALKVYLIVADYIRQVKAERVNRFRQRQDSIVNHTDGGASFRPPASVDSGKRAMQAFTNEMDLLGKLSTHKAREGAKKFAV